MSHISAAVHRGDTMILFPFFAAMFRLRVKTGDGKQYPLTDCLCADSTLKELLLAVQVITLIIPRRQKILAG